MVKKDCDVEYHKILKKMCIGGKGGSRFHAVKIFHFGSSSHPGKQYTTQINSDGSITCNCPGWVFKRKGKERFCKHTIEVLTDQYRKGHDKVKVSA